MLYTFGDDEEVLAAEVRPSCLVEPRGPLDRPVQQRRLDVDAPSLDAPALQRGEEEDFSIPPKMITVLTRYRPIVFELICSRNDCLI